MNRIIRLLGVTAFLGVIFSSSVRADEKDTVLWRQGTLSAMRISGDWQEIGAQASEMSRVSIANAAPTAINTAFSRQLSILSNFAPIVWLANLYLEIKYFNPVISHISKEDQEMMRGISAKTGIPYGDLQKAFATPEVINQILTMIMKPTRKLASLQACSSFAAFGPRTLNGERIFARNLDYPAVGSIDASLALYLLSPKSGYQMIVLAPEGFPTAGLTGMNEKGLVLALHTAFSGSLSNSGTPLMSVNREVLEHASTIEEAIAIYQKYQYEAGWMVHLSDRAAGTNKPRSAIVELSGLGVTYHFDHDSFTALTNSYQTPEQKSQELYIAAGVAFHNRDRLNRLKELVMAKPLTVNSAIDILRDSYSATAKSEVEYSNSGIRAIDQVMSAVFLPDQGKVLVAEGRDPASYGAFYEFGFDQMNRGLAPVKVRDAIPKPASLNELIDAYTSDNPYDSYRHLMLADSLAKGCSYKLLAGASAFRMADDSSADNLLGAAMTCREYNAHQKAIASFLHGFLQWRYGNLGTAEKEIAAARDAELHLAETEGISGNPDFIQYAQETLGRLQRGEDPDQAVKQARERANIDIKMGDNVLGWE